MKGREQTGHMLSYFTLGISFEQGSGVGKWPTLQVQVHSQVGCTVLFRHGNSFSLVLHHWIIRSSFNLPCPTTVCIPYMTTSRWLCLYASLGQSSTEECTQYSTNTGFVLLGLGMAKACMKVLLGLLATTYSTIQRYSAAQHARTFAGTQGNRSGSRWPFWTSMRLCSCLHLRTYARHYVRPFGTLCRQRQNRSSSS